MPCARCGSDHHSVGQCRLPNALSRETSGDTDHEAGMRPPADNHATLADLLALQNPTWPRTRCLLRASVEWQKGTGQTLLESSQQRMRA